jgi:hypothetical protein
MSTSERMVATLSSVAMWQPARGIHHLAFIRIEFIALCRASLKSPYLSRSDTWEGT